MNALKCVSATIRHLNNIEVGGVSVASDSPYEIRYELDALDHVY